MIRGGLSHHSRLDAESRTSATDHPPILPSGALLEFQYDAGEVWLTFVMEGVRRPLCKVPRSRLALLNKQIAECVWAIPSISVVREERIASKI